MLRRNKGHETFRSITEKEETSGSTREVFSLNSVWVGAKLQKLALHSPKSPWVAEDQIGGSASRPQEKFCLASGNRIS